MLCSELERAQHTARLVLQGRELPLQVKPELNEMFLVTGRCVITGIWPAKMPKTTRLWCNDWQNAVPTNGEGFQAFAQRVEQAISILADYQHHDHVLIVSHQVFSAC